MAELDRYRSWLHPGVAGYMGDLVTLELEERTYRDHAPYKYFLQAVGALGNVAGKTLVDAGCGVGHYSELCHRHFPKLKYEGFDFSEHMVARAREMWPGRKFFQADMTEFDYSPYDVVLASSLIEVMDDWAKGSEALCRTAKKLILHRVRVHAGQTVRNEDIGYPGQPTFVHVHNEQELLNFYEGRGLDLVWKVRWRELPQATYIFERG